MTISKLLANEDFTREFFEMSPRKSVREMEERLNRQSDAIKEHQEQNGNLKIQITELTCRNNNQGVSITNANKFEADIREIFGIPLHYSGRYDQIVGILKTKQELEKKGVEATLHGLAFVVGMDPHEYDTKQDLIAALVEELAALHEIKTTLVGAYDEIMKIANR